MAVDLTPSAVHVYRLFFYYRDVSTGSNVIQRIILTWYLCILPLVLTYRKIKMKPSLKVKPEVH